MVVAQSMNSEWRSLLQDNLFDTEEYHYYYLKTIYNKYEQIWILKEEQNTNNKEVLSEIVIIGKPERVSRTIYYSYYLSNYHIPHRFVSLKSAEKKIPGKAYVLNKQNQWG